ncbi:MAG: TPM domain-containing protein [Leptospiraceae bacterium]|nr:TPM domain-containing protein [Leptospiraceae bacterium]
MIYYLILFIFSISIYPQDEKNIPEYNTKVTDEISIFSKDEKRELVTKLVSIQAKTGAQVAILITDSTSPYAIEQYSIKVAEKWKLGRKGIDDGVIIIWAKLDKKIRIEVGRGLEGDLPDVVCKRIISNIIVPQFQKKQYVLGLSNAIDAIEVEIKNVNRTSEGNITNKNDKMKSFFILGSLGVIIVFIYIISINVGNLLLSMLIGGFVYVGSEDIAIGFWAFVVTFFFLILLMTFFKKRQNSSRTRDDNGISTSSSSTDSSIGFGNSDSGFFSGGSYSDSSSYDSGSSDSGGGGDFGGGGSSGDSGD